MSGVVEVVSGREPTGLGPVDVFRRPDPDGVPAGLWEGRIATVYRVLPYLLAVGSFGLGVVSGFDQRRLVWSALTALVILALVCWFDTLHPAWEAERRGLTTVYRLVRLALTAVAVLLNPWWGIFAWLGFIDFFRVTLVGGRFTAVVGLVGTAALLAGTEIGGFDNLSEPGGLPVYVVVLLVNVLVAGTMGGSFAYFSVRNEQRRVALIELAETNRKLSAALAENADLHSQLLTRAREAGMLDERARLAREIHDTIAQGLTGIVTQLQAAQRSADSARHVATSLELARGSLREARRSVQALRPAQLETAQLPDALRQIVDEWSAQHPVETRFVDTGDGRPLHPEIESTLLRVTQEALANVARHARAGRVGVTLSYMEDVVTLDVRDDGVGFDPAAGSVTVEHGGFGLLGMRQRVGRLAGEVTVESEPGNGTAVSVTVPAIPSGATA